MRQQKTLRCAAGQTIAAIPLLVWAGENVDLAIVNQIKTEAFDNSKVMDHMFYLTDVNGPRLTGSPGYKASADWVVSRMKEYGVLVAACFRIPSRNPWHSPAEMSVSK